ncbi:hypothetical protein BJ322DRAFT_1212051 [Thelephora terrestris]|uniref:BTB domain-containing protein n=1 Tax=Thelephora terrestris TaxID=56493 RepID=A0A9P6HDZ1_9AGAM|nr:hypothetical protein BJ322DRAFT_1212051 [Thelephora terrestris]
MATTTVAMSNIEGALGSVVGALTEENYEQFFANYCFLFELAQAHSQIPSDLVFDSIWKHKGWLTSPDDGLFYPTSHLILRFASDAESDSILASHSTGLRGRLCTTILREFLNVGLGFVSGSGGNIKLLANLVAHGANLGLMEEIVIRKHILQLLTTTSISKLRQDQMEALCILFKIAGATLAVYVDPSVLDRCFELLGDYNKRFHRGRLRLVYILEVFQLRERGWEGLPPPPVLTTSSPDQTNTGQEDPSATPVATSLGLPNADPEPQIPQSPPLESLTTPETEAIPGSPATQSPTTSIATLSDFTFADTSDDESPIDPTAIIPHDTFNFEDGNAEVLCGSTLFRVHTSVLSLHSPALRQMFARANLAAAESPNGCPRILSSDTATDFATLLKVIYLPGYPEWNKVPDFNTFSSLLRITAKYEMPAVRPHLIEVVRDAYPETFEGVTPTKSIGERVFSGPTPHPNEVLNLFVQQGLTSALPVAYYMAARRGISSLMDRSLSQRATLSPEILESAIKGFIALRELELNETYRLVLGSKISRACSSPICPSRSTRDPRASDAHKKVIDRITDASRSGTKVLQVLSLSSINEGDCDGFCEVCVKGWEAGHVEVRKKAWNMLPDAFGLKD